MSEDEQMAALGRMVTKRKQLQQKEVVLAEQAQQASKVYQSLSGYMANYKTPRHADAFEITPEMQSF